MIHYPQYIRSIPVLYKTFKCQDAKYEISDFCLVLAHKAKERLCITYETHKGEEESSKVQCGKRSCPTV